MHISMLAIPFSLTFLAAAAPFHQPRVCFNGNLQNKEITHILSRLDIQINPVLTLPSLVLRHLQPIITLEDHAAELQSEVDLSSIKHGDLHDVAVSGVDGGFYLTDSLLAAAQFACRNLEAKAYVLEYKWTGANLPVKEYQKGAEFTAFLDYDKHAALDQIMVDNDMITGPMTDKYADALITPYFRQYAVIKQRAATNNLKYTSTYEVPCTAVPVGKDLLAEYYTASQKSSPNFDKLVKLLMQCEPGIGPWQQAVDAENIKACLPAEERHYLLLTEGRGILEEPHKSDTFLFLLFTADFGWGRCGMNLGYHQFHKEDVSWNPMQYPFSQESGNPNLCYLREGIEGPGNWQLGMSYVRIYVGWKVEGGVCAKTTKWSTSNCHGVEVATELQALHMSITVFCLGSSCDLVLWDFKWRLCYTTAHNALEQRHKHLLKCNWSVDWKHWYGHGVRDGTQSANDGSKLTDRVEAFAVWYCTHYTILSTLAGKLGKVGYSADLRELHDSDIRAIFHGNEETLWLGEGYVMILWIWNTSGIEETDDLISLSFNLS
ncbi:uncharacterized protein C8R40DRAFT_1074249 [Lentinula edodes]|uniref:uncharacterized protein n=1 Tax=Lentinula edodes TaxID=5353 RepID=UPI001E8EA0E8|nr:uncharacterized protein C8R40DRAFT_1074249 [Lentinula edodes]KAH7869183.1 hypothetical protein C8R40DRAFT_1074249 [Lentinula edodes]